MAKTLIGNVKGKDGRGISKIEKTATTGVVDTYTITYTDGATFTYEVRNADNVAIQRQIVPSAAVESSTTASQAYSAGDYVVVGGVLRKVTASIAKGSTISDSNSTATTVTGEISGITSGVIMTKKFDQSFTNIAPGATVDVDVDAALSGWTPVCVSGFTSNHAGTFSPTWIDITSNQHARVTMRANNVGGSNWPELTVTITVLYVKAGVAGSLAHLG
jgi:hypothetical protein|nr:MAG TPA_asm: hypothetical protein [Caudoviricetes sp.]